MRERLLSQSSEQSPVPFLPLDSEDYHSPETMKHSTSLQSNLRQTIAPEDQDDDGFVNSSTSFWFKFKTILSKAIPTTLCMIVMMFQEMVNLIFLGHLNQPELLAGVGTGNMTQNMLGLSVIIGFNGALETLVSQAYGSGNLKLCGVYLNRGRFILIAAFIPVILILQRTEQILVFIG